MMRTYQQLTYEQRCQISALKKSGCSQRKIAETIETTVSRELARNTGARGYRHKQAQERTEQRRAEASQPTKMTPDMITVIESKLRVEWSPEQISGWLLYEQELLISHESIYWHLGADKHADPLVSYQRPYELPLLACLKPFRVSLFMDSRYCNTIQQTNAGSVAGVGNPLIYRFEVEVPSHCRIFQPSKFHISTVRFESKISLSKPSG